MMQQTKTLLVAAALACVGLAGGAQWAAAQTPRTPPPPRPGTQGPQFRDPTQPSPEVREAIEATQAVPTAANPAAPVVPQIKLKAKLIGSVGQPMAMLDINGQYYVVHADSEIEVPSGGASKILVRELNAMEVRLEMLPLKKVFVLR